MSSSVSRRSGVLFASIAIALASTVPAAAQLAAPKANGWGVPLTDVTPDPSVRYGMLPNGMKYAIMRNAVPKGGGAVRLRFEFGSIGESEQERGLAHFIEHMAFNGSTNVPEGDMIKILERQGLKFGPDTNAATGFDTTTYMLDLPQADEHRVDTALMLMRELASELMFDPAAVDRERGVILGERRFRDTYALHQAEDKIGFQVPETPYGKRLPIGNETVLKTAPAEVFRDLYRRYYRPENATLVFVGDADPADIERKVVAKFSSWKGSGAAGAPLPRGKIDTKRAAAFDTFVDPAVATTIDIISFRPWARPIDTLAERRSAALRNLALTMFNRRMERISNAPGTVILGGGMYENNSEDAALGTAITLVAKDGAWKDALTTSERELRRALEHGFTEAELKLQRADALGNLKTASDQADARTHQLLANTVLATVGEPKFVTTPAYRAAFFERIAPTITVTEVNSAFREMWNGGAPLVHVSAKEAVAVPILSAAFAESRKVAVAAPKAEAAVAFAYDSFGAPGRVVEDKGVADLGIRTIRFANNVRLNIKRTDFEKGKIGYSVRMAGGVASLPRDKPGIGTMLSMLSALSATGKHSLDDVRTISAGRSLSPGWIMSSDALIASGNTSVQDLALQMKLSAAYLTDPGYRSEAADQWRNLVPILDKQFSATPSTVLSTRVPAILAANDFRFGIPPADELAKRNLNEARTALAPIIASAPIEIGIVGDVDEAAAIKAVADSFGALAQRAASKTMAPDVARFRTDRSPILLTHTGGADQALVGTAWPTSDDSDYRKVVGIGMLAEVMDLMLTQSVREDLGASYGISVNSTMSDTYAGFGYLLVNSVVSPDKADDIDAVIAKVAKTLRDEPVSDDLLARARAPMLEEAAKNLRQNGYWLGLVGEAQTDAAKLDRPRTRDKVIRSITAAELQALATRYLRDDRLQRVRIVSDKLPRTATAAR